MEPLTFEDMESYTVKVTPIEFLGKRAYIRNLSLEGSMQIAMRYAGKEDDDATTEDMRTLISLVLCDKDGNLIFPDTDTALDLMRSMDADDLLPLFEQASAINGLNPEEEEKNLKADP